MEYTIPLESEMADILTEQIIALKKQQSAFKQASTSSEGDNEKSTQQKLPKGVVLDKDGKPFVTLLLLR